jgi:hypothetical protein
MAENSFVKVISFGLIGDAEDGDNFRHVTFRDLANDREADYIVYKKKKPELWTDIEHLETGKSIPLYKGYIIRLNGIDVVILGNEKPEEAFSQQKWKLRIQKHITRIEAESRIRETKGYCTNLTPQGAMEIAWQPLPPEAKKIKFRYYEGYGRFSWSKWFEISDD